MKHPIEQQKHIVWNHFVERWTLARPCNRATITGPRLRKIKNAIFHDAAFWRDMFIRHGLMATIPCVLEVENPELYDHAKGNFWGMVVQEMMEQGLIK